MQMQDESSNNSNNANASATVDFVGRAQELRDRRRIEGEQVQALSDAEEWREWRAELEGFAIEDTANAAELLERWIARPGYRGRDIRSDAARALAVGYIDAIFECDADAVVDDLEDYGEIPCGMPILRSIAAECVERACDAVRCRLNARIDDLIVATLDVECSGEEADAERTRRFRYSFPAHRDVPDADDDSSLLQQVGKVLEESREVGACCSESGIDRAGLIEETLVCIHSCETLLRAFPLGEVERSHSDVIRKNAARRYYCRVSD